MKSYDRYSLEDLVQDHYFRKWALGKLDPKDDFWETWIGSNPEKEALVQEACSVIIGLSYEPEETDSVEIGQAIARIQSKIHSRPFPGRRWFFMAAAVFIPTLTLLGLRIYMQHSDPSEQQTVLQASTTYEWKTNHTSVASTIVLEDGSVVILSPESKIGISSHFGQVSRPVILEGEAIFDVVKNPDLPFTVQSHDVVTKVLGTVFQVRSYEKEASISVSVKSGKVTVHKKTDDSGSSENQNELVLTPNQLAVISKSNDKIVKTLVPIPELLKEPKRHRNFRFFDTPISEVFTTLQEAYGISIAYDEEKLSKCNLTATLTEEDLFDGLEMICESIQANYRIADGQILINGVGCE